MRTNLSRSLFLATLTVIVTAIISALTEPGTAIGTAAVSMKGSGVARSTETIRYEHDVELLATSVADGGALADAAVEIAYREVWATVVAVLPPGSIAAIQQFNVVTDGPGGLLAMVHRSIARPNSWILSVDPTEPTESLERTLVHELAHLYTLGNDDLSATRGSCDGVRVRIGCADHDSVLAQWIRQFWTTTGEPAAYDAKAFVSQYAADSAHEDLAETFMAWVYGDAATSTLIADKYAFFDADDQFVVRRAEVRSRLTTLA